MLLSCEYSYALSIWKEYEHSWESWYYLRLNIGYLRSKRDILRSSSNPTWYPIVYSGMPPRKSEKQTSVLSSPPQLYAHQGKGGLDARSFLGVPCLKTVPMRQGLHNSKQTLIIAMRAMMPMMRSPAHKVDSMTVKKREGPSARSVRSPIRPGRARCPNGA